MINSDEFAARAGGGRPPVEVLGVHARRLLAVALLPALLAACRDAETASPDPTVPRTTLATTPPPSTAPPDPYAVPEIIDIPYVEKVMAAIDHIDSEVLRITLRTRTVPSEAQELLRSIYSESEYASQLEVEQATLQESPEYFRDPPGDRRTTVTRLLTTKPDCVSFEGETDFSEVVKENNPPRTPSNLGLRHKEDLKSSVLNPTPWVIFYESVPTESSTPRDPCIGS